MVNGLALGQPGAGGLTELVLPTVDDVHGADFTLWFWLVESLVDLVLVPTRAGLLRLKSVRDMIDLSVPREALQASVRAGVRIAEGKDHDAATAERSASRAFRNGAERRLVVMAGERYADAAGVLKEALHQIRVDVEVITAADPVADAVNDRMKAKEQLDAVLTDHASTQPISDLGGFGKAVQL